MDNCCDGRADNEIPEGPSKSILRRRTGRSVAQRILLRCERNTTKEMCLVENNRTPAEEFIKILLNNIIEALNIPWNERRIVKPLLEKAIGNLIDELLDDYLNYWVENYGDQIKRVFNLDKSIQPDYRYAPHARLIPVLDAVMKKYKADKCKCAERKDAVKAKIKTRKQRNAKKK